MKISFGSWAFSYGPYSRNPIPLETIARRLSEVGYDGIEICGFPPYVTLERYATPNSRRELARLLQDLKLGVSGYVPDFTMVNPTVESNRERYLELFRRNLEVCVDMGSRMLRVDSIAAPGSIEDDEYSDTMDRLASVWHDASELAAKADVRVVWEFEPGFAFNKPSEVVAVYEQVGHSHFQVLFDTGHAYLSAVVGARQEGEVELLKGGVDEFLDRLGGRIGHIHIADTDGTLHGEETSTHCPLGTGFIQWKKLAPKLKSIPGLEWWCIDLSFWPGSWELLEMSLGFTRRL